MIDYLSFHKSGNVPWDYAKLDLPLNIFEATAEDLSADRRANAHTGAVLGFNLPGELPARFTDDKKGIMLTMPEPKLGQTCTPSGTWRSFSLRVLAVRYG